MERSSMESLCGHNYTLAECRAGIARDMEEFGSRYSLLSKCFELLDTTQENVELVRSWFDLYMGIYDEASYDANASRLETYEIEILRRWYTQTKSGN